MPDLSTLIHNADEAAAKARAYLESLAASPLFIADDSVSDDERYPGYAPCPCCFESSGYVWEHGNDWENGPWSNQTNIPCRECEGTGMVEAEPIALDDIEDLPAAFRLGRLQPNLVSDTHQFAQGLDVDRGLSEQDLNVATAEPVDLVGGHHQAVNDVVGLSHVVELSTRAADCNSSGTGGDELMGRNAG